MLAVVAIVGDKAPRIDVWVVLQQGADALARGDNVYTQQWTDSPGVQDFFPYLPWMAVLTAPGSLARRRRAVGGALLVAGALRRAVGAGSRAGSSGPPR